MGDVELEHVLNQWSPELPRRPILGPEPRSNSIPAIERVLRAFGDQVAAVISERCRGNCAALLPLPGFLEFIRKRTTELNQWTPEWPYRPLSDPGTRFERPTRLVNEGPVTILLDSRRAF